MPSPTQNNLPQQLTSFVGRESEVAEVIQLLASARLLTLTGAGGSGKTRLSQQVASTILSEANDHEFEDGVFLVSLAPIRNPALVVSAIAQTLGVRESQDRPLPESVKDLLRDKKMLLLLDNFEQVLDAAPLLTEILSETQHIKVLVTSRETLHLYGEAEYAVQPLSIPERQFESVETLSQYDAVSLFVQRARAVNYSFQLTADNATAVAEICRRLDGLPLALELAAARIKVLPPQALLSRLEKRLQLLMGGPRNLPARQQTLRAAIDWSYDLLSEEEKRLFRRLAVFVGGRTLPTIEAVCNPDGDLAMDVLEGVSSLVAKSLLIQRSGPDGEVRFFMLETLHEYVSEKLQETGEEAELRSRHARFFLALVEEAEPHLTGARQQEWLSRLEIEHDNIRAALRWAGNIEEQGERVGEVANTKVANPDVRPNALEVGLLMAGAVHRFWHVKGHIREGREQLEKLLSIAGDANFADCSMQSSAKALHGAGYLAWVYGDYTSAHTRLEEALSIGRAMRDKHGMSLSLNVMALVAVDRGDYSTARTLFEESLSLKRELGDQHGVAVSLNNLGNIAQEQGDYDTSRALYEESLLIRRELGDKRGVAICLGNLGIMARHRGDFPTARTLFEECLSLTRELGDQHGIAVSLDNLGVVTQEQSDYSTSRALYRESLLILQALGSKRGFAECLARIGGLDVMAGQPERGARLLAAAEMLLTSIGGVLHRADRLLYERHIVEARSHLGEETFARALSEGRAISIEQAIELALSDLPEPESAPKSSPLPVEPYPNDLTQREVEVLRLVAEGLTNAQIAERLFISRNTVHAHLHSIYSKVGVSTRSAAARFATEQNIL